MSVWHAGEFVEEKNKIEKCCQNHDENLKCRLTIAQIRNFLSVFARNSKNYTHKVQPSAHWRGESHDGVSHGSDLQTFGLRKPILILSRRKYSSARGISWLII